MKAKIIGICASVAAVAAIVTTVILLGGEEAYRILKVFEVNGSGNVDRPSSGVISAYESMKLENGDTLNVDNESTIRLSLDDDKYILLDQNSVISLEAEGSSENSLTRIELLQGAILNEVTEALSADSIYEVKTPKTTMAVRGTSFSVEVIPEENGYLTKLSVLHGIVSVQLYDESGNPKGSPVSVIEGYSVAIFTENNIETGNSAEIDGNAYFVFVTDEGYIPVDSGKSPLFLLERSFISESVRMQALRSDEKGLLKLKISVADELRDKAAEEPRQTTTADTSVPVSDTTSSVVTTTSTKTTSAVSEVTSSMNTAVTSQIIVTSKTTTAPVTETISTAISTTKPAVIDSVFETSTAKTTAPEVTVAETTTAVTTTANVTTTPYIYYPVITGPVGSIITTSTTTNVTTIVPDTTTTTVTTTVPDTTTTTVTTTVPDTTTTTVTTTVPDTTTTTATTTAPVTTTTVTTTPAPVKFIVEFYDENNNLVHSEEVEENGTVSSIPAVPAKTGYTGVWQYNGAEYTGGTVTSNMTITAVYTINTYTVTYEADGVDISLIPESATYDYGDTFEIPEVPEKEYYTGVWTCNSTEYTAGQTVTVEDDMEFIVVYTPVKVHLVINIPNYSYGSPPGPYEVISIDYGKAFSENDRGFTVAELLEYFDNPYELYPDHMIYTWENYTASDASVLNTYDLTDDFVIDSSVVSYGDYTLNTDTEYIVYTEYYVNIYIDYISRT